MNDQICTACLTTRDKHVCLCRIPGCDDKKLKADGCLVLNDPRWR
jgi:hypothetical protein